MTSTPFPSFIHRFEPGTEPGRPPLLLLHGTGGDEGDLLPLGRAMAPGSVLLSPRGKVLENGMPRFFRRLAEGVFNEEDVRRRADELADFVAEARGVYGLPAPIAVGFSNGANIAAALLLLRPEALAAGLALHGALSVAATGASLLAVLPALAGMALSGWRRARARPEIFRLCFFVGLLVLGGELVWRGLT